MLINYADSQTAGKLLKLVGLGLPEYGSRFATYIMTERISRVIFAPSMAAVTWFCLPYPGVARILCVFALIASAVYIYTTRRHIKEMKQQIASSCENHENIKVKFADENSACNEELDQETIDRVNRILNTPTAAMLRRTGLLPKASDYHADSGVVVDDSVHEGCITPISTKVQKVKECEFS